MVKQKDVGVDYAITPSIQLAQFLKTLVGISRFLNDGKIVRHNFLPLAAFIEPIAII